MSLATKYVILFGTLLLLTNAVMGIVLMRQSSENIQALVRKNMLNISNTAAGLLDGDLLGALTSENVGGPDYQDVYEKLVVFQENVDIEYIYTVKQVEEDHFVFIVDPDPVDPGEFGEDVLVTNALRQAAKGIATVDEEAVADRWGNFYSSYSPVFDTEGKVAGIVGVDFNSEWFDKQVREHTLSITIISIFSILLGSFFVLILTRSMQKRLQAVERELSVLSSDVDELAEEIISNPGFTQSISENQQDMEESEKEDISEDEIEALRGKIHVMHWEMKRYLDFVHAKAYTDALTGVKNSSAYLEETNKLNEKIRQGTVKFSTAMFDINNLKIINDRYGHACGDRVIKNGAAALVNVFGVEKTFRIGGDEFLVIAEMLSEEEITQKLLEVDHWIENFQKGKEGADTMLSLSWGAAAFRPGEDHTFRDVFVRADEVMYRNKREYHRRTSE